MELKQTGDGKKLAKIQHVYKATQLKLANNEHQRYPANCKFENGSSVSSCMIKTLHCLPCGWFVDVFPSNCAEWEPVEALTGTFQAYHVEIGRLIYSGCPAVDLLARNIFFYEHTYVVPTTANGWGQLVPTQAPSLTCPDWPLPDTTSVALAINRIETDVKCAMKCTYGSHRATITSYMPIHLFVFFFRASEVHRTPTMWIAKGEGALRHLLTPSWDSKVVQHNGDTIKCSVVLDKLVLRYHIAKQQLSIVFLYRRWKLTGGAWEALNSDTTYVEQVELHVCMQDKEEQTIAVNEDWSLSNLREYLALRLEVKADFSLVVNGLAVRRRKERNFFCKDISAPHHMVVKLPSE